MRKFLAIDVGGTNIKYGLMLEDATILEKGNVPTPYESLEAFIEEIGKIYDHYKDQNLSALVMSAPGKIEMETGYFHTGGALPYLFEVDLKKPLQKRVPLPFTVINDAKAAGSAELARGAMAGVDTGMVITLGTGIGGCVIINGRVHNGFTGAAGEFSGIPDMWKQPISGKEETWADINRVQTLLNLYGEKAGIDPHSINGKDFFAALNAGDPDAQAALDEYTQRIASAIYVLQHILDVEKVAFGGGISSQPALMDSLHKSLDELFERIPHPPVVSKPELAVCEFRNDANLIGALDNYLLSESSLDPGI